MPCIVDRRKHARTVAATLEYHPRVVGADAVSPAVDSTGRWTVEVTFDDRVRGLPPVVLGQAGFAGFHARDIGRTDALWKGVLSL